MADPSLRRDIIDVLRAEGVEVEETDAPDWYRLTRAHVVLVVDFRHETVSNTRTSYLARRFGITRSKFYPPRGVVVPIERAKASGEK